MENEKAKKLTEHLQDVAANYIRGLVDGRAIREAMEKKKQETEEQRFPGETLERPDALSCGGSGMTDAEVAV